MSPKAPTNQRKKSNASTETDRRLARAQQLMDGNLERPTGASSDLSSHVATSNSSATTVHPALRPVAVKREERRRDNSEREAVGR